MSDLVEGSWYWVRYKPDDGWFPAKRSKAAAGGWTNEDTWEDFDRAVTEWRLIGEPR